MAFIRPHLDYGILFTTKLITIHQKMDSVQYNAALAITGAIRGTSREKLFQELGLESDCKRQLYRKLCYFFKIFKGQSPEYLFRILPNVSKAQITRTNDSLFSGKHNFSINSLCHQLSLNGTN